MDALLRVGSGWAAWCRRGWPTCDVVIWTLLFILTWKYVGFAIILFLAGLSNVPDELTEAAAIDGASWWQIQRHVTIPLLGPTIRIWMFLSMIGSLQVFDVIWVIVRARRSGRSAPSNTMATYMVDNGFFARLWGYGNAVAVILFVISFVAALLFQRFVLRRDIEGAHDRKGEVSMAANAVAARAPERRQISLEQPAHLRAGARGRGGVDRPGGLRRSSAGSAPRRRSSRTRPGCPTRGSGTTTPGC